MASFCHSLYNPRSFSGGMLSSAKLMTSSFVRPGIFTAASRSSVAR